ncbi:Acyltransferase 3 [Paraburkholderia ribeironis]|uniref:Acyltransferase 3 n=1 Tax=Paraburkholderia ribeironis TaxID=1247936 RepID=A0A1N7S1V9_9BURK|nr:acyltransferase [Paraburkholderia ribeironis]SIT41362.1 Acyltransferase 3 [Paraburkholderia ribeironis]
MRQTYLDVARGAGIILVVYGHVLRGVFAAELVPVGTLGTVLAWTDYVIYTFHMPLFFFLSGLHVRNSLRGTQREFMRSKVRAIVYPYLLWSILQGSVQLAMASHGVNHPLMLSDLLAIGWRPFAQFWFLYALMLCMMGAWTLARFVPAVTQEPMAMPIRGLLAGVAATGLAVGASTQWGILSTTLMNWPFFVLGILVSNALPGWLESNSGNRACVATAAVFAAAVAFAHRFGVATSVWAVPAAFVGIALSLQLSYRYASRQMRYTWLTSIGFASMPIYLMHILAMAGVRTVLMRAGITDLATHLALGTVVGVAVPMVAYILVLRAGCARIAGFPLWPGRSAVAHPQAA